MTDNNSNPTRDMIDALDKDNNVDAEVHFKNALSAKVGQEIDD